MSTDGLYTVRSIAGETFVLAETDVTWEEAHAAKHEYHHAGYKARIIDGDVWVGGPRAHMPRCCIATPPSAFVYPPRLDRDPERVHFTTFPIGWLPEGVTS